MCDRWGGAVVAQCGRTGRSQLPIFICSGLTYVKRSGLRLSCTFKRRVEVTSGEFVQIWYKLKIRLIIYRFIWVHLLEVRCTLRFLLSSLVLDTIDDGN